MQEAPLHLSEKKLRLLFFGFRDSLYLRHTLLSLIASDIPFSQKGLNESDQKVGFLWIDVYDYVDIRFHVSSDIADFANRVDGIPSFGIYFLFERVNFVFQAPLRYPPEVSNHALKTAAGKSSRSFRR